MSGFVWCVEIRRHRMPEQSSRRPFWPIGSEAYQDRAVLLPGAAISWLPCEQRHLRGTYDRYADYDLDITGILTTD